ncbi:MAG: zinc ribbon domain-containing protein [Candidatus Helarchaeota archaeon]|nr:zinc ribbon domain-containing protein [Candidatus Helarchaeota archaeon]
MWSRWRLSCQNRRPISRPIRIQQEMRERAVTCPECGHLNSQGAQYCEHCGTRVEIFNFEKS